MQREPLTYAGAGVDVEAGEAAVSLMRSAVESTHGPRVLGGIGGFAGLWRLAGDTATDFNHYTKRATLSAVYTSTLLAWLDDDSEGFVETRAFLDRRLADVMRIEKLKANWRGNAIRRPSLARFLGRLRYPVE